MKYNHYLKKVDILENMLLLLRAKKSIGFLKISNKESEKEKIFSSIADSRDFFFLVAVLNWPRLCGPHL